MIKKLFNFFPPKLKIIIGLLIMFFLKPLRFHPGINLLFNKIVHMIGWYRVIKKGDIIIQGGVDYTFGPSFIEPISKIAGDQGLVVGVEPSPISIKYVSEKIKKRELSNNIVLINKAISDIKDEMNFVLGKKGTWNRLDRDSSESLKEDEKFSGNEIKVQVDTIDNIIKKLDIDIQRISFVSLTINGQEYNGLIGMKNILKNSKNLSINVVAGREKANPDIGLINGVPDIKVIRQFLENFGFKTKYFELKKGKMGYVMAKKGESKFFIG